MVGRLELALDFMEGLEDSLLFARDELRRCREEMRALGRQSVECLDFAPSPLLGAIVDSCLVEPPASEGVPEGEDPCLSRAQIDDLIKHVRSEIWSHLEVFEGGLNQAKILSLMLDMDSESEAHPPIRVDLL